MSDPSKHAALPSFEDIESWELFPGGDAECAPLCDDYQFTLDELQTETDPAVIRRLKARLKAVVAQLRAHHCRCFPQ